MDDGLNLNPMNQSPTDETIAGDRNLTVDEIQKIEEQIEETIDRKMVVDLRAEMKRTMIRYVVPAFLIAILASGSAFFLTLRQISLQHCHDQQVRVDSREQVREVFFAVIAPFPGQASTQITAVINDKFPSLPPVHC